MGRKKKAVAGTPLPEAKKEPPSSRKIIIATVLVLFGLILLSSAMFKPQFENPALVFMEEPLAKNKELQLQPGELYTYSYYGGNLSQASISYQIFSGRNCTEIVMVESFNRTGSCVDRWGNDGRGYNSTLENPQVIMFKPWMLALKDGWHWNATMFLSYNGSLVQVGSMDYRVIRTDEYRGRQAFIVRESASDAEPQYEWVDVEKRVLLKILGPGYEVNLTEGLKLD